MDGTVSQLPSPILPIQVQFYTNSIMPFSTNLPLEIEPFILYAGDIWDTATH